MKAEGSTTTSAWRSWRSSSTPSRSRDFVYVTFNAFADRHPWVGEENIRPKSIAREMFEGFRSFSDYVQEYDLERAEGLLLRHLNSVYKVLGQTVPDTAKTDTVREMELYLRDMLRAGGLEPARGVGAHARPRVPRAGEAGRGASAAAAGGAARRHARHEGLHRRHPHAAVRLPARLVDRPGRGGARRRSTRPRTKTASRGRRRGCAPPARRTASSTASSASIPRRGTSATPPSSRPATARPGACSRCWSTRKASTTG